LVSNWYKKQLMIKSILWRLIGVIFLAMVTFFYTGSLIQTSAITFVHHFVFIWVYYLHEIFWVHRMNDSKNKKYIKVFTYEIILGNGILGTISWIFTGSWTTVTAITLTYILNKLWMYYIYDKIWEKHFDKIREKMFQVDRAHSNLVENEKDLGGNL